MLVSPWTESYKKRRADPLWSFPMPASLKILLVENHLDTLTFLTRYLEIQGHVVECAQSVKDATALLAQSSYQLLISDISLPDGDGWALMKHARLRHKNLVGIAMSGLAMESDRQTSLSAGYAHHLTKPFLPEDLDSILSGEGFALSHDPGPDAEEK